MTYQALTTAITGLRAAQQQLSTISNNVTNATTPGYNRQIVPQETQILRESGQTVGVLTNSVIRVVDMNLQRDLWTQISATNAQNVQVQYLEQIQNFNGPPDKEFSIASKIAELRDSFSALSDTPDDSNALEYTLNQAQVTADKFNDYAELITRLRNDAQSDINSSVTRVNGLLEEIANINIQIRGAERFNSSVAGLQDERDIAIKQLTEEIDITFFERSDGVLVVQTREGLELAGDVAQSLSFDSAPLGALQYYPDSASALNVVNIANKTQIVETDITDREVGGRLGGLLALRDDVLPSYHAQLDELAYQIASRFDAQGLALFTDQNGNVPVDGVPDPNTSPPTSVPYVDFSRLMQVNTAVINDVSLIQRGTYTSDAQIPTGDNALVKRVLENVFGSVEYQEINGSTVLTNGTDDLQTVLGIQSQNRIVTGADLGSFQEIDDGVATTPPLDILETFQDFFPVWPNNDQFQVTFEEPRLGLGPTTITVDLSGADFTVPIGGGVNDALDQIVTYINNQIAGSGIDPALAAVAERNTYGQLVISSTGNVTIDGSSFANSMGADAMAALGIPEGSFTTEDPYFTVQVGNNTPVQISLEPGETLTDLVNKLEWNATTGTGVPGLFVDTVGDTLYLRPGIDDSNGGTQFGGEITITGGPYETDGTATNAVLAGLSQPVGLNIVNAIFGSYTDNGTTVTENSPLNDVTYQSQVVVPNPITAPATFTNFRNEFLGPNAGISTGIFSADNILDYAQKIIDEQSQDYLQAQSGFENEDTLRGILQRQFSDQSGVNIDEEMSNFIVVQTAYAAAARTITAADEMFQELLNSIRR